MSGAESDLLISGIGELVTNSAGPGQLGLVPDAAVAVRAGLIDWAGPASSIPDRYREGPLLDVEGRAVLPGFVDAHTHLVFGGDRADEFGRRLRGDSYEEILAAGGGIHSTVAASRAASDDSLHSSASARARRMLATGTTTAEVKSGYGLSVEDEVRMLRVAAAVADEVGITIVPTLLAHVPPRESDADEFTDLVVGEMVPAAAEHAVFCDVFCDRGAFSVDQARRILVAGADHGLGARIHAEQLSHTGAASLAAELGAASADHLDQATPEDAAVLAAGGVSAVLLPAVSLSMRSPQAPGRMLWDAGVRVALATDCNPGTSYVESMPLVVALASLEMGLTPEEALWAATAGGAASLRLDDRGAIATGKVADMVVLDAPSYLHLAYRPGTDLAWAVIKDGKRL